MAIDTGHLNRSGHFTIDVAIAVVVLLEVAINAMHADIHMH